MAGKTSDWVSEASLAALRQARTQARRAPTGRAATPPACAEAAPASVNMADERAALREAYADARPLPADDYAHPRKPPPAPIPKFATTRQRSDAQAPPPAAHLPAWLPEELRDTRPLPDRDRLPDALRRPRPQPAAWDDDELPADENDAAFIARMMRDVAPLRETGRIVPEKPRPAPLARKRAEDEQAALHESLAPLDLIDRLDAGIDASFLRPGIARRVLHDLRRGRYSVQGELDLHGLTRDSARAALAHFLVTSLRQGLRCVRVIHGKGLGSPGGHSILKQLSRGWLAQREEILAFCQARPTQGGDGALLVLLRAKNARTPRP